jgi:phospholipase D1/2
MTAGILNPNSETHSVHVSRSSLTRRIGRHETPEEKLHDDIRAEINASHRFESFAGERENNFVKWCVLRCW